MGLMVRSTGTWAVERSMLTLIRDTDHYTKMAFTWTVNSQNAFGQTTSVPVRNRKTDADINSVSQWVGARFPAKYLGDKKSGILQ
jgi:hypothetical protein